MSWKMVVTRTNRKPICQQIRATHVALVWRMNSWQRWHHMTTGCDWRVCPWVADYLYDRRL